MEINWMTNLIEKFDRLLWEYFSDYKRLFEYLNMPH